MITQLQPYTNDYILNRDTFYADANQYNARYVEQLSEDEQYADYQQRLRQTPAPTHARRFAQRILGAFTAAMKYCVRYGAQVEAVEAGRGVDNCGKTMAEYIESLAVELAIDGKVGVSVDRVSGLKPYCVTVSADNLTDYKYAGPTGASVLASVEYSVCLGDDRKQAIRWYMGDNGHAFYQVADNAPVDSMLPAIPFVVIEDPNGGIIPHIAQHQRLLSNLLSVAGSESPGLLQSFLVRNRDTFNAGVHQRGIEDEIAIGKARGLWYGKGEDAPAFIGQPAAPAAEARQWVSSIVADMEALAGIAGDTDPERARALAAAAGSLGAALQTGERMIWNALDMFMAEHARVIKYPLTFERQTETERQDVIEALYANAQRASGRTGIEEATVLAVEQQFAGQPSAAIQRAVNAIKAAPCLLNDEMSIIRAYEAKMLDTETACNALGCKPDVAAKAQAEAAERAKQLAQAAALAAATKPADQTVGGVGSDRDGELAQKQLSQVEQGGDVRGENR